MSNFLERLEPRLKTFRKDELIFLFVLWRDFNVYGHSRLLDMNIALICQRVGITEKRYREIIAKFERVGIIEVRSESKYQKIQWVAVYLPNELRKTHNKSR